MSLDTLLEAAHFIEWSHNGDEQTRGKEATEFHHYAKPAISPETQGKNNGGAGKIEKKPTEEEMDEGKEKQRPTAVGMREVHNKLEKNRRAHLKECFDMLRAQIPHMDDKKTSNLNILRCALRYIQFVKRQEKELEQELQRLAQAKIASQQRIAALQGDLAAMHVQVDLTQFMADRLDDDVHSVSTATADESPIVSENEGEDPIKLETFSVKRTASQAGFPASMDKLASPDAVIETKPHKSSQPCLPQTQTFQIAVGYTGIKTLAARKHGPDSLVATTLSGLAPLVPSLPAVTVDSLGSVSLGQVLSRPCTTERARPPAKQPVTKLLQQTIAERWKLKKLQQQQQHQQLQQQQQQQQQQLGQEIQLQHKQLQQQQQQPPHPTQVLNLKQSGLSPVLSTIKASGGTGCLPTLQPTTMTLNHLLPSILPAASIFPPGVSLRAASMASSGSTSVQPATITALNRLVLEAGSSEVTAMGVGSTNDITLGTVAAGVPMLPSGCTVTPVGTAIIASSAATPVGTAIIASSAATPTTSQLVYSTVAASQPRTATVNMAGAGLKQILASPLTALPTAQLVSPAQLSAVQVQALQQLMAQGMSRATTVPLHLTNTSVSMAPLLSTAPSPTNNAATHTQFMAPMNIISTPFTHTQVLKTAMGNIPIISPYTLPIKPLVMVTLPNIVTTAVADSPTITTNVNRNS